MADVPGEQWTLFLLLDTSICFLGRDRGERESELTVEMKNKNKNKKQIPQLYMGLEYIYLNILKEHDLRVSKIVWSHQLLSCWVVGSSLGFTPFLKTSTSQVPVFLTHEFNSVLFIYDQRLLCILFLLLWCAVVLGEEGNQWFSLILWTGCR